MTQVPSKRRYSSQQRTEAAEANRQNILDTARRLFVAHGISDVTIARIAAEAGVAGSTVYALFASKAGLLRGLMERSMFGARFNEARTRLSAVTDPVEAIRLSAGIARAIYDSESEELSLLRGVSTFSEELSQYERELEQTRRDMQADRIDRLFAAGQARQGLTPDDARQILWMYTSREVYRMLVRESGWSPDKYERWLSQTLAEALANPT